MLSDADALLAHAAPLTAKPSASVKAQLMARIRAERIEREKLTPAEAGWRFESARSAVGWMDTFPGVRFKPLSVDPKRDVAMVLVEIAPGARFPDHPHSDTSEEFLILSGDLRSGGRRLIAGDYFYAAVGTEHTDVSSEGGCTALLSLRAAVWQEFSVQFAA